MRSISNSTVIGFNKPFFTGKELYNIADAHQRGKLSGDGEYTRLCSEWLEKTTGANKALLTNSCTSALDMAAILANINPGDEIIMPSYTFVSTANAFVLRGGVPVFVDIRPDTLNIDETLIEAAVTDRTRAIVPVHYAGVGCEMDIIMQIAVRHGLLVIEDAAQGIMSSYKGRALGTIGQMGAYSFHETKNIISGEGGTLLINDPNQISRAEIVREKGTNRSKFLRGQVDKYTWHDIGSSYLPGEIMAAFLLAQLERADFILEKRLQLWNRYHDAFKQLELDGRVTRPFVPAECSHNAHMYYLLLKDLDDRTSFIEMMAQVGINCVFHYVPLHSSPFGQQNSNTYGSMQVTDDASSRLVRLPMWLGLEAFQDRVIESAMSILLKTIR
jgi:dTDP-4-amino-4,6-dideoxygalactose transaminase